jgi:hypothetical protein
VSLAWAAAAGASSYNVYEGASMSSEGTVPVQTGLTSPSASVGGLHNGTVYFFQIAAVNAGGTSAASNEASATPTAPSGGGGGGGSMDWLGLGLLALLASTRRRSTSYLPRGWSRRWRRWSRTPCHPQITSNTTLSIRVVFHTAFPILLAAT